MSKQTNELYWDRANDIHTAYTQWKMSKRDIGTSYFATVRPVYGSGGVHDIDRGFVVTRLEFGDLREFADLADAKLYVESLYALERES